jgi:phage terminase large subunit-like protein
MFALKRTLLNPPGGRFEKLTRANRGPPRISNAYLLNGNIMGMRGIGATPKTTGSQPAAISAQPERPPGGDRAQRVIRFVETLPCTSGLLAGTNLKLRSWQKRFIRAVYKTDKAGKRCVRTAVLSVGRKNGKTQLAAALALAHLSGPEAELRGECYSVACTRFQAGRVFAEMVAIITRTPWLKERINIIRFRKELEDLQNGSSFAVLAADVAPVHGLSPSFVCYDELAQVPSRALYDALGTALGGRAEPLIVVISTQAARDEAPMSELVDYGLRVQRGEVQDPGFHLTLFTAPMEADPWALATWKLANPALGDFRSLEDVKRLALQAQRMPASEFSFRNLILNQRVDTTAQFIDARSWDLGGEFDLILSGLPALPCYAGLDLGATKDMTALVLVFVGDDGEHVALPFCWLPGETLQKREDEDGMPYRLWAQQGHLLTFPGRSTDPRAVATKIAELHGKYKIKALAFDRWRIEDISRELDAIGCNVTLVPFGQGFKDMGPAVDKLEGIVDEGKLLHANHPVLKMAAVNAKAELDAAGNRKLSKRKSTGRIDPLVALTMAIGVTARAPPPIDIEALIA